MVRISVSVSLQPLILGEAPYKITIDGEKVIETETLIIATGASAKYLGLPDEHKYAGMGVSACATCDGFFYRKKTVAVVGGGDTACEEAIYLAGLAKQVYLIVRKPYLRASKVMQERVFKTPNITVLFEHNTLGLFGENGVEGAHLVKRMGEPDEEKVDIAIDGFFLAIGHKPNSDIFKPWIDTDEIGYIETVPGTPERKFRVCLPLEMSLIPIIVKLLPLREVVVRLLSRLNVIYQRSENS